MESPDGSDRSVPETPREPGQEMRSPPGLQSHHVQHEDIRVGVTPSHVNLDNNPDDGANAEEAFVAEITNSSTAMLLDFPVMRQSNRTSLRGGLSFSPNTSRSNLNMTLNRETVRRGRRRSSSFDDLLPVPRITLRPRFSALTHSTARMHQLAHFSPSERQHQPRTHSCSCNKCMACLAALAALPNRESQSTNQPPADRFRPRIATHFRHHTYSGSDSSNDIFAAAMELEENSADRVASSEHEATVPIIHNPFELSQMHQNLPPAAQTFVAPRDTTASNNRSRPRHRKRSADVSFPCPTTATNSSNRQNQAASTTTQSFGTPTCTTICSSSISAFDQTSPNQWQDQSPGNCSIFQGLKSVETPREEDDTNDNDNNFQSEGSNRGDQSTLPFDEVHLLMDQGDVHGGENEAHKQA